jgi:uncharacterized protein (DUF736 family)
MDKANQLGALWLRKSKDGHTYFSGKLEKGGKVVEIVVFANKYKEEGDKKPDWIIYKSEPKTP